MIFVKRIDSACWQAASDTLAENFEDLAPYTFAYNNPILYNDPTGLAPQQKDTVYITPGTDLEEVVVTGQSKLDIENGQVRPPVAWWEYFFGWGDWYGWEIDSKGYLTGRMAPHLLSFPDLGGKGSGLKKAPKLAEKYIIYKGYKNINGKLKIYIGKAKDDLKKRYTSEERKQLLAGAIEKLDNLPPDNGLALGIERAIIELNGGLYKVNKATANLRNPTANKIYLDAGKKWLNENIPNWEVLFKFNN